MIIIILTVIVLLLIIMIMIIITPENSPGTHFCRYAMISQSNARIVQLTVQKLAITFPCLDEQTVRNIFAKRKNN